MLGKETVSSAQRLVMHITRGTNSVGVVLLMGMMLIVVADVFLRIFFNSPIIGSYELVQFLLVAMIFLGLPNTTYDEAHISVSLATSKLPRRLRLLTECVMLIYSLFLFVLMTMMNIVRTGEVWELQETSYMLSIPLFPFYAAVALGCAIVSVVLLLQLFDRIRQYSEQYSAVWVVLILCLSLTVPLLLIFRSAQLPFFELQPFYAGVLGIMALLVLIATGMPIGIAMGLIGFLGYCALTGYQAGLSQLALVPFRVGSDYLLSVVPFFILMGHLALYAGLSQDLYETSYVWLGQLPGGLAMATVGGCAAFAAVSGSSLATAVTVGSVALPGMRKYKYNDKLALGSIAAGGTIGILIPPSLVFILYGIMTEQSIGSLFLAGILPGVLTVSLYLLTIAVVVGFSPSLGPRGTKTSLQQKLASLRNTWGMVILFILVLGGIYLGLFTPTEAGAIGAFGALLIGIWKRRITWQNMFRSLLDTGRTTAMLLMIFIGAMIFNYFLAVTNLPIHLAQAITGSMHNRYTVLFVILLMYLLLGCIMDPASMIILTIPIIFPIVQSLGFDPIWFGVLIVIVAEIGCITPPVGINVFAVKGIAEDVPIGEIFKGILPFWITDIIRLLIVIFVPFITLFLPNLVK
jgi:tripartite ATP-independent transporter DctM subunit